MQNQWGQDIGIADIVGSITGTGISTERKIGTVIGLTTLNTYDGEVPAAVVEWAFESRGYAGRPNPARPTKRQSRVRINNLFKLVHWTLGDEFTNAVGGLA